MADDVFAFLRGTCHLFYVRLPRARLTRSAPAAWACGDLHLANFGSYRGDNHLVYFDLNDFDEGWLRSSGRQGSAMADSLIRYWSKPRRSRKLLALATQCSEQIEEDWEAYRLATWDNPRTLHAAFRTSPGTPRRRSGSSVR